MGRGQGRRALLSAGLLVALLLGHDAVVPPSRAYGARAAVAAIDRYRATVSPRLRGVVQCRFQPTCSWYGHESIRKYGLVVGGLRTMGRIARCGPWTPAGTVDPP